MMTPLAMILAINWLTFCWHFLGVILILLCLFLTAIILMQDSKGAGLTSAFGAGPGGESLLGARMQKDVARWTAITAGIFGVIVLIMGLLGTYIYRYGTVGAAGARNAPAAEAPELPGSALPGLPPEAPKTTPPAGATPGGIPPAPAVPPAPVTPPAGSAVPTTPPTAPPTTPPPPQPAPAPAPPPSTEKK